MSDQPSSEPSPPPSSARKNPLSFDEFVALLVAFGAIGAIFFWAIARRPDTWSLIPSSSPSAQATTSPIGTPSAAESPGFSLFPASPTPLNPIAPPPPTAPVPSPRGVSQPPVSPSPAAGWGTAAGGILAPVLLSSPASPVAPATPAGSPQVTLPSVPPISLPAPSQAVTFKDVPDSYWASPFINALAQRGIAVGFEDGSFQPDRSVTRAEYAALIQAIFESGRAKPIAFADVAPDFWGARAIDTAVRTGFVKGYPGGIFSPQRAISRMEVLLSLVNGLRLQPTAAPAEVVQIYQDKATIPEWAMPAMATATQLGMVVNYPTPTLLNPKTPASRAEVAVMLYQALVATGEVAPIQSEYIVQP